MKMQASTGQGLTRLRTEDAIFDGPVPFAEHPYPWLFNGNTEGKDNDPGKIINIKPLKKDEVRREKEGVGRRRLFPTAASLASSSGGARPPPGWVAGRLCRANRELLASTSCCCRAATSFLCIPGLLMREGSKQLTHNSRCCCILIAFNPRLLCCGACYANIIIVLPCPVQ